VKVRSGPYDNPGKENIEMRTQSTIWRVRIGFCIGSLILCLTAVAWSQAGEWTIYDTRNSGLPYNGVTALAIDAEGILWVGTGRWWAHTGGGLAKFDGTNWTVYNASNSGLPDNDHVSLSIDAEGNIWSGTENGLSKFDGTDWTVYKTHNSGLQSNHAGAPVFDDEGNAWIPTFPDGGLAKFDGDNWTVYKKANSGLPNDFITGLDIDARGNIWAGTFGSGVAKLDGTNWTVYHSGNSALPHNDTSFLCAAEDNVWIGTYGGGLAKSDGIVWRAYTAANSGLPDNWIWNLNVDPQGNVWAGTKAGLARFDGVKWTVYDTSNSGLPDNNVYCIAFDADSNVWIGTQDGGLVKFRPQPTVDLNGDGTVDIKDLLRFIESWGQDDPLCDVGPTAFGDGIVDAADLEVLMNHWGRQVRDGTLVAHWALDEMDGFVAHDDAGNHDATVMGLPAWQPAGGVVDGALGFDGATFVAADCVLDPMDGPFSVLAWVKGGTPGGVIVSQQGGASWLMADAFDGSLMTDLRAGGRSPVSLGSQTVIADGNWHRVAFTWDSVNRRLYVDDVLVAEDTQAALGASAGNQLIGCGATMAADTFWSGLIDDVRIYNRAVNP
jgi:hypothetical protein